MKDILISVSSVLVVGTAAFFGITTNLPKPVEPVVSHTPIVKVAEAAPEPVEAPQAPKTVTVTQTTETPVVEPVTPSNEDLIAEYGWTSGSDRVSIDYIMQMFPRYFTETERVKAFSYLNSAALSNAQVGDTERRVNSISVVKWYFQEHYLDVSWVNVGLLTGVDTSYYGH